MQTTYILSYVKENVTNLPARRYTLQYVRTRRCDATRSRKPSGVFMDFDVMTDNSPSFFLSTIFNELSNK